MREPKIHTHDGVTRSVAAESGSVSVLALLAEIAILVRHGSDMEQVLTGVATALCRVWRNDDNRVWVRDATSGVYRPFARVGASSPPAALAEKIRHWSVPAEEFDDARNLSHVRIPLIENGNRLGLLEATIPVGPDETPHRQVVDIVAALLTVFLALARTKTEAAATVLEPLTSPATGNLAGEIVDSLPVGLYVIDREYRVLTWNRQRETGTLVDRDHAVGRSIFDVLRRMPRERLRQEFDTVFRTGRAEQIDVESRHTGETRHHRITKVPLRAGDGDVSHVITISEDLTEWMSFQQQQVALAEKLGAVGQLAAGVMHELNNPLATIGACVEALSVRTPGLSDSVRSVFDEYLQIIDSELARCQAIIDGLLDFSRPTSRAKRLCDANQIVDDALFLVKHHDRFRHIELVRTLTAGIPWINGNTEQLIQVFVALMLNAIDAMEGDGVLTVTSSRNPDDPNELVVRVSDTGVGIPREHLAKIFDPFFTSKQPGQGTGLGLAICYRIVAQHQGRIAVDSQVDHGSTFSVFLPVAPRED